MMKGLGRAYAAVGENHQAEKYLLKYVELAEKRDLSQSFSGSDYTTYYFIATFYFKIGQFDKAEKYFNTALVKWHKGSLSVQDLYKSNFLFKLDSVRGNYVSAIRHLQTSQSIKDSIFTATKSKQIENLKITYETEQKDSLLKLNAQNINLLTKQGELQKSKLEQATVLRNITFIAATLLFVVMLLLVTGYRNKQKSNMKLRLQQAEIKDQNKTLQHLVNEKDWLVKEIHHRVKNNMQIVMSLLNSQSAYIESESALSAIHDSQHRVYAMSLIHQKLYGSGNLSSIDMSVYIRELGSYLADSFNTGQRIRFEYQIEPLELDVSQAVPLGLILNEAITNSIKYAFPNQISGNIFISLSPVTQYQYILSISDNGIGMPSQPGGRRRGSLGMSLMAGLSEDLNGNFSFNGENGTTINVSFLLDRRINEFTTVSSSLLSSN